MTRLDRRSEAQANAEAAHRRDHPYRDLHAASLDRTMDRRRSKPKTLGPLVRQLRRDYEMDFPIDLHDRDLDDGGTPRYDAEFAAIIGGDLRKSDGGDKHEGTTETYTWPVRAALARARESDDPVRRFAGRLAHRAMHKGPVEAAVITMGDDDFHPSTYAEIVALWALSVFWDEIATVHAGREVKEPVANEVVAA